MHNHLRQNMCAEHPNRNLANGPNHPGPGPEEIPMPDVSIREDDGVKEAGGQQAGRTRRCLIISLLLSHVPDSTYQRIFPLPNASYGPPRKAPSRPATPLPDHTTLPREPTPPLTGVDAAQAWTRQQDPLGPAQHSRHFGR